MILETELVSENSVISYLISAPSPQNNSSESALASSVLPTPLSPRKRKTPPFINYLGKVLPFAIMGMLVVFCLKGVSVTAYPYGIPEIIGVAAVVLLHIWRRNTLLSIGAGTVIYILLVNFIFK